MPENLPGEGIGHFFGAMRIDAFRSAAEFKTHMDKWIQTFRSAKTIKGEKRVFIPGDIEREMEEVRMKEGIPLLQQVIDDLNSLGEKFGIQPPTP
jgi:LDH2 family malate/lactate/ureidoglycolate dehydrogenase